MVQQILVQMGAAVSPLICVEGQLFPLTWASSMSERAFLERSVQQEQTCFNKPKIKLSERISFVFVLDAFIYITFSLVSS